ncbi:peptide-methionine (S)-S-oxide reductase MsrA [Leptolyngbya sp. BC1307]|uniref:peptide-methionine (S)-S-oxide reductase MsrA n=1 Tax=Leptolyngbya sp. BC1307 TaxID=2029589 RepID=UPI001F0B36E2|nr:peptide-methionine (S)-S-oxide reductase MsrA [Leptolyngbya sp. BC1307]
MTRVLVGLSIFFISWGTVGCAQVNAPEQPANSDQVGMAVSMSDGSKSDGSKSDGSKSDGSKSDGSNADLATATFAGGCFWCMEPPYDQLPGVVSTTSGYTGGTVEDPTYTEVSAGGTGHVEAMQVRYDPSQVSYETLLETFWHNIDPLDEQGQFCDKGSQYRSVVFYENPNQQSLAQASKQAVASRFDQPIATEILPADDFYPAEDYHQNYYETRPIRYKVYRFGCGRDQRLSEIWGADAPDHE